MSLKGSRAEERLAEAIEQSKAEGATEAPSADTGPNGSAEADPNPVVATIALSIHLNTEISAEFTNPKLMYMWGAANFLRVHADREYNDRRDRIVAASVAQQAEIEAARRAIAAQKGRR